MVLAKWTGATAHNLSRWVPIYYHFMLFERHGHLLQIGLVLDRIICVYIYLFLSFFIFICKRVSMSVCLWNRMLMLSNLNSVGAVVVVSVVV